MRERRKKQKTSSMKAPPWLNDTVVGLSSTVDALKIYCLKSKAIIVC